MATIKFGAIVTDIRGKLGGHVFQKGNQSRVLKTNANPRKRVSYSNTTMKNFIATNRNTWRGLSIARRQEWNAAAGNYTFQNAFNDNVIFNGFQFFLRLTTWQAKSGYTITTNPATIVPGVDYVLFTAAGGSIGSSNITLLGTGSSTNIQIVLFAARGAVQVANPDTLNYAYIGSTSSFNASSTALFDGMEAQFGEITTTQVFYFKVVLVNASGFFAHAQIRRGSIS